MPASSKVIVLDPDARAGRQIQLGFQREGVAAELATSGDLPTAGTGLVIVGGSDGQAVDLVRKARAKLQSDHVDAPIVFVGYGIEAPEYKWNDYKGTDVRGKVLLMLVNEPPSEDPNFFKGQALTFYGRWVYKYAEAARKGAVGVILIHKTEMASYGWDVVRNSWAGENSSLQREGPALKLASWLQLDVAREMATASGKNLDQMMEQANSRDFRPIALSLRFKAHLASKVRLCKQTIK